MKFIGNNLTVCNCSLTSTYLYSYFQHQISLVQRHQIISYQKKPKANEKFWYRSNRFRLHSTKTL